MSHQVRLRKHRGLTVEDIADVTGHTYGSLRVMLPKPDVPRHLKLAVVVFERMLKEKKPPISQWIKNEL